MATFCARLETGSLNWLSAYSSKKVTGKICCRTSRNAKPSNSSNHWPKTEQSGERTDQLEQKAPHANQQPQTPKPASIHCARGQQQQNQNARSTPMPTASPPQNHSRSSISQHPITRRIHARGAKADGWAQARTDSGFQPTLRPPTNRREKQSPGQTGEGRRTLEDTTTRTTGNRTKTPHDLARLRSPAQPQLHPRPPPSPKQGTPLPPLEPQSPTSPCCRLPKANHRPHP